MINLRPIMKYIMSFNDAAEKIWLPVPPSSYEIKVTHNNTVVHVSDIGELNMIGTAGLMSITLEGFFPAHDYYFCQCRPEKPYAYVQQVLSWKNSGKPLRLMVTGTRVNHAFAIESFDYAERDGTGDVYFSISLKEYRFIDAEANQVNEDTGLCDRADERELPEAITIMPGDDAMDIARRAFGDADVLSRYRDIVKKGITPGDVLRLR